MLGIIRVLTTNNEQILNEHGNIMKRMFNIDSVSCCIPDQPHGVYDSESEKTSIPKIIKIAHEMSENYDIKAITISCASEPGLTHVKGTVDIPVIGAGTAGAHAASMIGDRIGIIGITENPPSSILRSLGNSFHSYVYSQSIRKTTDLFNLDSKKEILSLSKALVDEGVDGILFACTGFSTINLKNYLAGHLNIPVIDLVEAQALAYRLIQNN